MQVNMYCYQEKEKKLFVLKRPNGKKTLLKGQKLKKKQHIKSFDILFQNVMI